MKDIFSRPVIETTGFDYSRIDNNETPDQSAETLYGDNSLFYVNLLLNNTLNKNYWPINEIDFTEKLNDSYKGYSFHILEKPSFELERGDVIITTSDLAAAEADTDCVDNPDCYPSYGIIEKWDPILRKIWIREYTFGNAPNNSQKESALFKEDNTFKIFRRNGDGSINIEGVTISNASAFDADPNYTPEIEDDGTYRTFKMKQVHEYMFSLREFIISGQRTTTELNPYMQNLSDTYSIASYVGDYNAGNTNGTCSLLDAYILEANGQTGSNNVPFTLDNRIKNKELKDVLIEDNEEKRYVDFLRKPLVGNVVETLKREYNAS